jgi:hypothetical protein
MDIESIMKAGEAVGIIILGASSAGKWWLEHRKKKNKPDLNDTDYDDMIGDIMDGIQTRLSAYRCSYWAFSNGSKTADGYSLKYFSIMCERNRSDASSVLREMQNLPVIGFKRNMAKLKLANRYIFSDETKETDELSKFHQAYTVKSALFYKICTRGKWNGILGITFDSVIELSAIDEAWLEAQMGRIEHAILQMTK